jgi:ascorbate PTS system EIIC component
MDILEGTLEWIATNIFNEVAILIGLITLVGLLLQRKPVEDVTGGALRATLGVIILFIGIDVFVGGLLAFQTVVSSAFGLDPPAATATLGDFLTSHGGTIALVITVAFLAHLILVRALRLRYVYLTGHLMFWISVIVTAALVEVMGRQTGQWTLVFIGAAIVATYWTLQPIYVAPLMRKVIGSDDWGYGHTSSAACYIAGTAGRYVGSREQHDTEKLTLPRRLSFFKDINVSTALVIGVILLVAMIFAEQGVVEEQAAEYNPEVNPWIWGVIQALRFAAGIAILLFGVRMFLAEIVPAFKGISERVIPGSRPALDVPTVFPFAPTAVILGFVSGTLIFLVLMAVFAAAGWFTLVPPMIMLFFPGAGAAVFGNAVGGWRGAVLGGVVNGVFLAVGQAVTWGMLSSTAPELATLADPDWYILTWLILFVANPFSFTFSTVFGWLFVATVAFGLWRHRTKRRRGELEPEPEPQQPPTSPADTGQDRTA